MKPHTEPQSHGEGLCAALLLALLILLPAPARAQGETGVRTLAFQGIGAWLYQVVPARSEPTTGLHLRGDLGRLAPRVRLSPSVTFWATRLTTSQVSRLGARVVEVCEAAGTPCPDVELGEVQLSDLSLDLDARYLGRGPGPVEPYVGVGAGLHLVNGGGGFIDNTFVEDILDAITPGLNAMAGVQLPLGRGLRLHAEVRGVVAGGANWIGAGLGGSITLPTRRAPAVPAPEVRP
ncbi:MAG TPA: hypothetical protein VF613_16565 [Longimicrobium sp.]|jgi:hypothetical protein